MNYRLIPVIFLLLTSACTVYRDFPIEVYHPAEVKLEAKDAALVYRNFKYREDTLQHFFKSDYQLFRAGNDPENLDSLLVTACIVEVAGKLKENQVFEEIHIYPYHAFERHTGEHLPDITPALIGQVTSATQVDLLILLETYSTFFSNYSQTADSPKTHEVITAAVWAVYDAETREKVDVKTLIDTIYWNGYDQEGNYQPGYRPPSRLTALEMAATLAGENFAKRFSGSWQTVNRMYSVPPLPDFSNAAFFLEEAKWDEAIELWEKYADNRNGKMAIDARYNLALAYEMKDDLVIAQSWLNEAYSLAKKFRSKNYMRMIETYQKILKNRIKNL